MALKNKSIIKFNYHDTNFRVKEALEYKTFLASVLTQEGVSFNRVEYIFCTDPFLLTLNKQYLNHDTYTDILTFTLSLPKEPVVSEIYISIDRVKENALKLNVPFIEELSRVMIHGLLHLSGYEDATEHQKAKMRSKEDFYLAQLL